MCLLCSIMHYFYPRSPCGERLVNGGVPSNCFGISIHALLAESDCGCSGRCRYWGYFYPRSPCGERPHPIDVLVRVVKFLSTLSLRRATQVCICMVYYSCISIHALLAESDIIKISFLSRLFKISIHALLAESDLWVM